MESKAKGPAKPRPKKATKRVNARAAQVVKAQLAQTEAQATKGPQVQNETNQNLTDKSQRWWVCKKHSRYLKEEEVCLGDVFLQGQHERVDELLEVFEGGSETSEVVIARQAEEQLREFLEMSGIANARQFRAKLVDCKLEEDRSSEAKSPFELAAVAPSLEVKTSVFDLFRPFLENDGKVRRAGSKASLGDRDCLLEAGTRVFFEVAIDVGEDAAAFVKNRCERKVQTARAFNGLFPPPPPEPAARESVLVYVFNGGDAGTDWEKALRDHSPASAVFDRVVFVWCAHAMDLGLKLTTIRLKEQLAERERVLAERTARSAEQDKLIEALTRQLEAKNKHQE